MAAILKEDPPELSATGKNVPPGVERIVRHCLEKSREERFHSARDLAFDLEALSGLSGASTPAAKATRRGIARPSLITTAALIVGAALIGYWIRRPPPVTVPSYRRLTFRRGRVTNARFAPDGRTIVYSAEWESAPPEIFAVRTDSMESRSIGLPSSNVLSVSSKGELAVLLRTEAFSRYYLKGALARVPIGGGTPRELAENVLDADWSPDGNELAIVRSLPDLRSRLEYPIGRPLYEGGFQNLRVSPKGDLIALLESDLQWGDTSVSTVDLSGHRTVLSTGWKWLWVAGWSATGDEIIVHGGRSMEENAIVAISVSGRERVRMSSGFGVLGGQVTDISPDGRLLVLQESTREEMRCRRRGDDRERDLSWLDNSRAEVIAEDGSAIVFGEMQRDPTPKGGVYLRKTDGSPAVRLGDGIAYGLSEDGHWVLAITDFGTPTTALAMLPTGAGMAKKIPTGGLTPTWVRLMPDGKGVVFSAEKGGSQDLYAMGLDGGSPRSIHAEGLRGNNFLLSPDGERVIFPTKAGQLMIVSTAGGPLRPVPGPPIGEEGALIQWSTDGHFIYEGHLEAAGVHVDRRDLTTGKLDLWRNLLPEDPTGIDSFEGVRISRDGQSYAYSYERILSSDLWTVQCPR
jgi:hypothetical protein